MASAAAAEAPREGPPTLSVEEEEWADPDVEQRVVHIASQFGIRPVSEPHLLWIAAEAATAALPPEWREVEDQDGRAAFEHKVTGNRSEEHPAVAHYARQVEKERQRGPADGPVPGTWVELPAASDDGVYYFNVDTGERTRARPEGAAASPGEGGGGDTAVHTVPTSHQHRIGRPASLPVRRTLTAAQTVHGVQLPEGGEEGGEEHEHEAPPHFRSLQPTRPRDPRDLRVLEFSTWWREAEGGELRSRAATISFDRETGNFQMEVSGEDKMYTFSHLTDRAGRHVGQWDLYVGARLNVASRPTTLMNATHGTIAWIAAHHRRLSHLQSRLRTELAKYDGQAATGKRSPAATQGFDSRAGKCNLRVALLEVETLRAALAEYRPTLAERIAREAGL